MSIPNDNKPICPNCGQWQHNKMKADRDYYDCLNECAARGFAKAANSPAAVEELGYAEAREQFATQGSFSSGRTYESDELSEAYDRGVNRAEAEQATQPQVPQVREDDDTEYWCVQAYEYKEQRDTLQAQRDSAQIAFSKLAQAHDEVLAQRDELLNALQVILPQAEAAMGFLPKSEQRKDGQAMWENVKTARAAIARATKGGKVNES